MNQSRVAFITGCSSGLGLCTAAKLIQGDYIVYATIRSLKDQDKLKEACSNSTKLFILTLDLTDDYSIQSCVNTVLTEQGRIDVVIHNAAASLLAPVDATTPKEAEYLFNVNVLSVIKITQLFLPQMRKQNAGHLLFIGSISGVESSGYLGVYSATKFALEALVCSWATTLHKWNIKTTLLEPGAMNTDLPNSIQIGSFYSSQSDNPYKIFNLEALKFLKQCLKQGTDPDNVAAQIFEILQATTPKLRYQTCPFSQELVENHLRDPNETKWINDHRQFIDTFYYENEL